MRLHRALGHAGGARGVTDPGNVVGTGLDVGELCAGIFNRLPEVLRTFRLTVDHQHAFELGAFFADCSDLGVVRTIGNQYLRTTVVQAIGNRIAAEQHRAWPRHHAALPARDVGDGALRILREQQADAVTALEAEARQRVGELIGVFAHLGKRIAVDVLLRVFIDQCHARGLAGPAVTHIVGDVVELRNVPLEVAVDFLVGRAALE